MVESDSWRRFVGDHFKLADATTTEMFTIPNDAVAEIQTKAAKRQFNKQRYMIPALSLLAEEQGMSEIDTLEDIVPLLFSHTTYKTYSIDFIKNKQYHKMTQWYNKLTPYNLDGLPSNTCYSLDDWLIMLYESSPVPPRTSSGTTKTSLYPQAQNDQRWLARSFFIYPFQGFGDEPFADLELDHLRGIPYLHLSARYGPGSHELIIDDLVRQVYDGDESKVYALSHRVSADRKLQAGAAAGPAAVQDSDEATDAFFNRVVDELAGGPILAVGASPRLFEGAMLAKQRGLSKVFTGGFVLTGAGTKGRTLPPDFLDTIKDFFGGNPRMGGGYGCSEQMFNSVECPRGNYHPMTMIIVFLLDVKTGELLPRTGTQRGRYAFFNTLATGAWGGLVTGDEVTISWDEPCGCGRNGPYIHPQITRLASRPEGDSEIALNGKATAHGKLKIFLETAS